MSRGVPGGAGGTPRDDGDGGRDRRRPIRLKRYWGV